MALTVLFAWRYRQSNTVGALRAGLGSLDQPRAGDLVGAAADHHLPRRADLDGHASARSLSHASAASTRSAPSTSAKAPLEVEVVALDWKWLFIYPDYGIATVNELAAPVDRPINFRITASSVMNSFYIPALAGQIYAMPGMETQAPRRDQPAGTYKGFSANYSGAGFSGMHFAFHGLDDKGFRRAGSRRPNRPAARSAAPNISSSRSPARTSRCAATARVDSDLYRRSSTCASRPARCA